MEPIKLSLPEWRFVARALLDRAKTLPSSGSFQPYYNATTWDHDDLYRAAREDAVASRLAVKELVAERKAKGTWPRGRFQAKFWLRARWDEATTWAESLASHALPGDCASKQPRDMVKVVSWLVYDLFDAKLVDLWLAENLGGFTSIEHYGSFPEDEAQYANWLQRLESGYYLRKSSS